MPELPEVEAARRAIEEHCVGKKIMKSTVADDPKVIDGVSSADFEAALAGKTIVAAHRKGKNMWLQLDSPPFPSFQFGMAGAVYIKGVAVTKYKRSAVKDTDEWPSKYSKLFVELEDGLEFSFTDKRRFAKVRLLENPVSMPPISGLGPDALLEPMTVDEFHKSLSKKKIGIKALLLDQARIHPLQIASSISKETCSTLLKCINEVIEKAIDVGAESNQFPSNWIFHSREKKPGKAFVDGKKIEFINAGGRTTAYVADLQKLMGSQAVKESGKPSKGSAAGNSEDEAIESENDEKPRISKAVKGRKNARAKKPSSKEKPSFEDSDDDGNDNEASDVSSKRTKATKPPPATRKPKGNGGDSQTRQTRGKSAPAKRKHDESDEELGNSEESGNGSEDEEAQEARNGKRVKAGNSVKKKAAVSSLKGKQKKKP